MSDREEAIDRLCAAGDYAALEKALSQLDFSQLLPVWTRLKPLDKLVVFKLLDAPRALDFYGQVSFKDKYFLLCGFPLNAIAPVLEKLSPMERLRFTSLPRKFYDRMFRRLAATG